MYLLRCACIAQTAGLLIAVPLAHAMPDDLDSTFGANGVVIDRSLLGGSGEDGTGFRSLALLRDGRAVVQMTERCSQECAQLAVARYTNAGDPDPSVVGPPIGVTRPGPLTYESQTTGAAVGPDGSLIVGYATPQSALVDVTPAGVVGAARATADVIRPEVLTGDGTLVARAGSAGRILTRLRPDGSPDPAFGRAGGRRAIPATVSAIAGVAVGDALRVGGVGRLGPAVWRVRADGTGAGRVTQIPVGGTSGRAPLAGPFAVNSAGRSVQVALVGFWPRGGGALRRRSVVAAFLPDGRADRAFGDRGVSRFGEIAVGAAVQANGKVVLATRPDAPDFAPRPLTVRRFNADGSADPSFRAVRVPSGEMGSVGDAAVAVDGHGRIVVASGAMRTYGDSGLLLARLRGGEVPVLKLSSVTRLRTNTLRVVATSSVSGPARITVRQSGRTVGMKTVRFTRGSRQVVTVPLRGARAKLPLVVNGTLRGAPAVAAVPLTAAR